MKAAVGDNAPILSEVRNQRGVQPRITAVIRGQKYQFIGALVEGRDQHLLSTLSRRSPFSIPDIHG